MRLWNCVDWTCAGEGNPRHVFEHRRAHRRDGRTHRVLGQSRGPAHGTFQSCIGCSGAAWQRRRNRSSTKHHLAVPAVVQCCGPLGCPHLFSAFLTHTRSFRIPSPGPPSNQAFLFKGDPSHQAFLSNPLRDRFHPQHPTSPLFTTELTFGDAGGSPRTIPHDRVLLQPLWDLQVVHSNVGPTRANASSQLSTPLVRLPSASGWNAKEERSCGT